MDVEGFKGGSHGFKGERREISRRQHSIEGDHRNLTANQLPITGDRGWGEGKELKEKSLRGNYVILSRQKQNPPHPPPPAINDERSLRYSTSLLQSSRCQYAQEVIQTQPIAICASLNGEIHNKFPGIFKQAISRARYYLASTAFFKQ